VTTSQHSGRIICREARHARWFVAALVAIATLVGVLYISTSTAPPAELPLLRVARGQSARVIDAEGRQVLLRGADVNSLGAYWHGSRFRTVFPLDKSDPAIIQDMGWDVVRLVVNWSEIEPTPGHYNDRFLSRVASVVQQLARVHVYTILDMHQDGWSGTLAAPAGDICPQGSQPNLGWDGAPAWATLGSGLPHCYIGTREASPAVKRSWEAFYADAPGPGGIGIETRFASMWSHVATRFAHTTAIAGFDIINEPMTYGPSDEASLAHLYRHTFQSIRAGEHVDGGLRHIVYIEPPPALDSSSATELRSFANDGDVAYSPHIYTGSFPPLGLPDARSFTTAALQAHHLGDVPVVSGEWGGRPRSRDPIDLPFYWASQALQNDFRFGAIYWLYKSSCGDPHELLARATHSAGLYDVDCQSNHVIGIRSALVQALSWPYPHVVTGVIDRLMFDPSSHHFLLSYRTDHADGSSLTEIAMPKWQFPSGYHGTATGAAVSSSPSSHTLLIHDCSKATAVTVDIAPGRGPVTAQACPRGSSLSAK
jgi:endoglycosylceramidase